MLHLDRRPPNNPLTMAGKFCSFEFGTAVSLSWPDLPEEMQLEVLQRAVPAERLLFALAHRPTAQLLQRSALLLTLSALLIDRRIGFHYVRFILSQYSFCHR